MSKIQLRGGNMKTLFIISLLLFGCVSQEPISYEKLDRACNRLCKDIYGVKSGTVSRVSNIGVSCYCGEQ